MFFIAQNALSVRVSQQNHISSSRSIGCRSEGTLVTSRASSRLLKDCDWVDDRRSVYVATSQNQCARSEGLLGFGDLSQINSRTWSIGVPGRIAVPPGEVLMRDVVPGRAAVTRDVAALAFEQQPRDAFGSQS